MWRKTLKIELGSKFVSPRITGFGKSRRADESQISCLIEAPLLAEKIGSDGCGILNIAAQNDNRIRTGDGWLSSARIQRDSEVSATRT